MNHSDAEKSPLVAPAPSAKPRPDPRRAQALRANLLRRKAAVSPKEKKGT